MSVLADYNSLRCLAEKGKDDVATLVEKLALPPVIAHLMTRFPEWDADHEGFIRDCRAIRRDHRHLNPYWCAVACACHAEAAGARGNTRLQLKLLEIADDAIHQIVPPDPTETHWILATVNTARMNVKPELFMLGTYLYWTHIMVFLGIFDAPSRVQRVVKKLLKLRRPDDARKLIEVMKERYHEADCFFSQKQYDELQAAYPELFKPETTSD